MAQLIMYDVMENKEISKWLVMYCMFLMLYYILAVTIVLFGCLYSQPCFPSSSYIAVFAQIILV